MTDKATYSLHGYSMLTRITSLKKVSLIIPLNNTDLTGTAQE